MSQKKIFVLDTSVILYDHESIHNFEEHDVAIPITVLEELDNFKKGNTIKNFEAREFIRFLDSISGKTTMKNWRRLNGPEKGRFKVVMNENPKLDARQVFGEFSTCKVNARKVFGEFNTDEVGVAKIGMGEIVV